MGVKRSFLNGYIEEEIYVEKSDGFEVQAKAHKLYRLKKDLCDLKISPRLACY